METNDGDDDFPFSGLFSPMEKIFADFDRLFSGFPSVFSIPPQEFKDGDLPQPSESLRDEVLKRDIQNEDEFGDEDLDATVERHGLHGALPRRFSSSSTMTTMQRQTTPSGKCLIEKKVQQSSTQNENSRTETISRICGDKYLTTVKQDGKIVREYGNATTDELDQIDQVSSEDCSNKPIIGGNTYSDLFRKLFS